jgi:hypothetical protein
MASRSSNSQEMRGFSGFSKLSDALNRVSFVFFDKQDQALFLRETSWSSPFGLASELGVKIWAADPVAGDDLAVATTT